jgi:hypothetical protein
MPVYEFSWTIGLQTNDESALEMPFSETALSEMYPSDRGAPALAEGVNIYTSTDGGRQGQISVSQRVTAGNPRTARKYLVSGNSFASQPGMVAVINNPAIDVCVSLLTVVDIESGISVVLDMGHHIPDVKETTPTTASILRRRRGRPRRSAVVDETTVESEEVESEEVESEESEEEVTEEAESEESEESEEEESEESEEEESEEEESEESEESEEEEAE